MRRVLLAALGAAILLLLWWSVEAYDYVAHLPSQARDRAASAVLLERQGVSSRRLHSQAQLFPLPDTRSLLIIRKPRGRMQQEQLNQLKHWIADGGTLVLEVALNAHGDDEDAGEDHAEQSAAEADESASAAAPPGPDGNGLSAEELEDADPLAYALGITAWHFIDDVNLVRGPVTPAAHRIDADWAEGFFQQYCLGALQEDQSYCMNIMCGDSDEYVAYSSGELDGRYYQLDLDPHGDLLHRDLYEIPEDLDEPLPAIPESATVVQGSLGNGSLLQLLALDLGQGRVIAMTDTDIWSNERLHHLDHARLLVDLVRDRDEVIWVEHVDMPPLLAWLWPRAWPLMSVAVLMLLVLIWRSLPRRGPILAPGDAEPLDFIEHLRASGRFLWRHGQTGSLLAPLRKQVTRRLDQLGALRDNRSRAALAASLTDINEQQIRDALELAPEDASSLTRMVNTLQLLRSKL